MRQGWTVQEAIDDLRKSNIGERIFYFYVADETGRLVGVVPTRRLLTSAASQRISDLMIKRVVAIPNTATVFDACEFFVLHKFFALPIVDEMRRIVGVVDISLMTEEVLEVPESDEQGDVFEVLGFHLANARNATPVDALRYRCPWLIVTLVSGTAAAAICGLFQKTLAELLILSFFLPMVLGLGESVSMQSMALTIQVLKVSPPTRRWYMEALRREAQTAGLLGITYGSAVTAIIWLWRHEAGPALAIGGSVLLCVEMACLLGLSIPSLLHALKLDPKIAAGPVTLAMSDILSLLLYFGIATVFLS